MAEKQGAVIGADLKLAHELKRRDLSLARAHHVERDQPLVQRDVAVFHHGPDGDGEGVLALGALVHARPDLRGAVRGQRVDPGLVGVPAVRAASAVGPADALEVRTSRLFRREASHHGHQREVGAGCVLRCHDLNVPEAYLWRNKNQLASDDSGVCVKFAASMAASRMNTARSLREDQAASLSFPRSSSDSVTCTVFAERLGCAFRGLPRTGFGSLDVASMPAILAQSALWRN